MDAPKPWPKRLHIPSGRRWYQGWKTILSCPAEYPQYKLRAILSKYVDMIKIKDRTDKNHPTVTNGTRHVTYKKVPNFIYLPEGIQGKAIMEDTPQQRNSTTLLAMPPTSPQTTTTERPQALNWYRVKPASTSLSKTPEQGRPKACKSFPKVKGNKYNKNIKTPVKHEITIKNKSAWIDPQLLQTTKKTPKFTTQMVIALLPLTPTKKRQTSGLTGSQIQWPSRYQPKPTRNQNSRFKKNSTRQTRPNT